MSVGNLGLGVMIRMLGGNYAKSVAAHNGALGKKIQKVEFGGDQLLIRFTDKTAITFEDKKQSCCEHRYMTNEGDTYEWAHLATFDGAEIKQAPSQDDPNGEAHDVQFLEIKTSKGVITISSHNEHNGYYGGFSIEVSEVK